MNILFEIVSDLKNTFLALLKMSKENCVKGWQELPEFGRSTKRGATALWVWFKNRRATPTQTGTGTQSPIPVQSRSGVWKRSKQKIMFGFLLTTLGFLFIFRPESAPEVVQKTTDGAVQAQELFSMVTVLWVVLSLVLVSVVYRFTNQHLTYRNSRTLFWLLAVWAIVWLLIPSTIIVPLWVTITLVGSVLLIMFKFDGYDRAAKWDLGIMVLILCAVLVATNSGTQDAVSVSGTVQQLQSEIARATNASPTNLTEKVQVVVGEVTENLPSFWKQFLTWWYLIPVALALYDWLNVGTFRLTAWGTLVFSALAVYMVLNPADVLAWQYWFFHHNVGTERFMELWYIKWCIQWIIIRPLPLWIFILWYGTCKDTRWHFMFVSFFVVLIVLPLINHGIIV
jgi:hypothetical protein